VRGPLKKARRFAAFLGVNSCSAFVSAAVSLAVVSVAPRARGQEVLVHATAGGAHALVQPQQSEYGFGGSGTVAPELVVSKAVGFQIELGAMGLGAGSPPSDPRFASHGTGSAFGGMAGIRLRPFAADNPSGFWLDGNGGFVETGDETRPGFDAHIGYDWRMGSGRLDVGPFVGYTQVMGSKDDVEPGDAHIVLFGMHGGFGAEAPLPPPGDRDHDNVIDPEDACPDVPGIRTARRETNGCPPRDRDHDLIVDADDACPDTPGVLTSDPSTNGCPPDQDGSVQANDDCPEGTGIKASDLVSDACPKPPEVRLVGDEIVVNDVIHFDVDSPRVWPDSYPLMKKLAELIVQHPEILSIDIEGHADETGTDEHNMMLSKHRAEAVKWMLVQFHISPKRITTHAYGEHRPRVNGHDATAHRENRRVEFLVTRAGAATGAQASY
jgi:outer membrane protein OmpA-like peptidoglycan-associated protein